MTPGLTGRSALSGLLARLRSLWRGVRGRAEIEAGMTEEFRHHLEMRTEDLVSRGYAPEEAARQARLEFGHIDSHKEDARASRGLHVLDQILFSWLDVKLGLRMLVRYPGLTVVGGLALAFGIFGGAGTFQFINQFIDPILPLPAGERIVGLRYWDQAENEVQIPVAYDLLTWREELRTVEDLGGFRTEERNLAVGREAGTPVRVARISSAGFRIASVPPLLGRPLVEADEEAGASPVVVLGHRVWQMHLGGDSAVVGRLVRVGDARATVIGVMPEGFAFPVDHMLWVPLRLEELRVDADPGEPLRVFGRLAPGATREAAQAEASALAARAARHAPERYEHLRAQVLPYIESLSSLRIGPGIRVMMYQVNVYAALFLVLVSANVALLMFARTATREREIVVRTALGASRRRIVTQLFVEALVLAALATALGLGATEPALAWVEDTLGRIGGGDLPFWFEPGLSAATAIYAGLLALLSAAVAGVVPALKATGRDTQARLSQAGGGGGGPRLGGIWTGVVVTQIAATVAFSGVAYMVTRQAARSATLETYFPAEQFLGARLELDRGQAAPGSDTASAAFLLRYTAHAGEMKRRLAEHPAVAGVTLTGRLPLKAHATAFIEVEDTGAGPRGGERPRHEISSGAVDLDFLEVLQAPVLAGRAFDSGDLTAGARPVLVTASFVDEVLGGRSAMGRRIRYVHRDRAGEPGPWHEIVGIVRDLGTDRTRSLDLEDPPRARVYHPLDPVRGETYPLHLVAHVRGPPEELVPVLHRIAESVGPALRVHEPLTLDEANSDLATLWRLYADLVTMVSAVALFLALAGIYAVMSFTVARRTREIGVRVALGAKPSRVIAEIFRQPFVQIGAGVVVGCLLVAALAWGLTGGRATAKDGALLVAWGVGMVAVCALACIGPTLRALRVEPAEALSAEA